MLLPPPLPDDAPGPSYITWTHCARRLGALLCSLLARLAVVPHQSGWRQVVAWWGLTNWLVQLDLLRAGITAELVGPAGATASGGLARVAAVGAVAALVPKVRRYRV